jgi:hypothetical protein
VLAFLPGDFRQSETLTKKLIAYASAQGLEHRLQQLYTGLESPDSTFVASVFHKKPLTAQRLATEKTTYR